MDYKKGIFIKELKNRFKAEILIDGISTTCYVGSSCKLNKLINLSNREVILQNVIKKNSNLEFSLIAAKFSNKYIILNSTFANIAYENYLIKNNNHNYRILKEHTVSGYKSDFYINETRTIIEIKSLITENNIESFPQIKSQRFERQISNISRLIKEGYNFRLIIVSLNPTLKKVVLKDELSSLKELLEDTFQIEAYSCSLNNKKRPIIKKRISLQWVT